VVKVYEATSSNKQTRKTNLKGKSKFLALWVLFFFFFGGKKQEDNQKCFCHLVKKGKNKFVEIFEG